MNTKKNSVKRAFTLVELIIVIAIIAILAVTAFLLLTKWLSKARDSSRASNLANIEKSLQITMTDKTSLPKPDSYTLIYASGTSNVIGYQGFFGEGAKDAVGNINSAPKDGDEFFTYYLNADLNKYQLAGFLENETAYNPNVVNAVDYSARFVTVKGDRLGLLTDANKSPLQTLGLTGLDILNTNNTYTAYISNNDIINGTGLILKSLRGGVPYGLIGYWSFDEGNGTIAYDNSGKGNNGTLSGSTLPVWTGAKLFGGIYITGGHASPSWIPLSQTTDDNILNLSGKNSLTIVSWVNPQNMNKYDVNWGGTIISSTDGYGLAQRIGTGFLYLDLRFVDDTGIKKQHQYKYVFNENQYYYLATIYNQNKIIYYVNGEKIGEISVLGKPLTNRTNGFMTIGCDPTQFTNGGICFNGIIDEVRMYDRALSDDEVKTLYNSAN